MFSLFYCLHTSYILVQLIVEHSNYSNKCHIQRCRAYQGETLISMWIPKDAALIRGWRYLKPGAYQREYSIPKLSNKLIPSLRNQYSEMKALSIDEVSMVLNPRLYQIQIRLLAVCDIWQLRQLPPNREKEMF